MKFFVYHISMELLKPYVQYILFNFSDNETKLSSVKSFPNTNFCLGIVKDQQITQINYDLFSFNDKAGIHSYLTGIYLKPFTAATNNTQDEICINFTSFGYYQFFHFPAKTYILQEDILKEAFGKNAVFYMEKVFEEQDFVKRGRMIESFLIGQLLFRTNPDLQLCLFHLESLNCQHVRQLADKTRVSKKQLLRLMKRNFDISPKDFIRVTRFRSLLGSLQKKPKKITPLAYEYGFADQSHLIRDFQSFTGYSPLKIIRELNLIDETVWLSFNN